MSTTAMALVALVLMAAPATAGAQDLVAGNYECIIGKCLRVWSQCVSFEGDGLYAGEPSAPVA